MDAAAAVVGFVGLAGQTLQGCIFLCDVFTDAKSAPEIIANVLRDVEILKSVLESTIDYLGSQSDGTGSLAALAGIYQTAVTNCRNVIDDLIAFLCKITNCVLPPTSNIVGQGAIFQSATPLLQLQTPNSRWTAWQKLNVARHKKQLTDFHVQLQRATSILWSTAQQYHNLRSQKSNGQRSEEHNVLFRINEQIFDNTSIVARDVSLTKTRLTTIDDNLSPNGSIICTTKDAIMSSGAGIQDAIQALPSTLRDSVYSAVRDAIADHDTELPLSSSATPVKSRKQRRNLKKDGIATGKGRDPIVVGEDTASKPTTPCHSHESTIFQGLQHNRGPKRRQVSKYNLYFGILEIVTTCTTQDERGIDGAAPSLQLKARSRTIILRPQSWLLHTSLMYRMGYVTPCLADPFFDPGHLRVFNTYPSTDVPIVRAMEALDYGRFRELICSREATPFDIVIEDGE